MGRGSSLPTRRVLFVSALVSALITPVARAQDAEPPAPAPHRELVGSSPRTLADDFGVWAEAGLTAGGPAGEGVVAFSPELGARFRLVDDLVADVSWGFTVASVDVRGEETIGGAPVAYADSQTRVDAGNPVFQGLCSTALSADVRLEIGLGLAVPIAARDAFGVDAMTLAQRAGSEVSHRAAMSMRGYWSPWRWAPERFSLFLPARVVGRLDALLIEGEIALGVMIPVLGDSGVDADVVVQAAFGVGAEVAGPLNLGVRLRGVGGATGVMVPGVVMSAEPWVRLRFDPVQFGLRGSINLNGQDGLVGRRGPGFGVFLNGGVEI